MNEETRSRLENYVLLVKTVHGDPSDKVTVTIKGNEGQTEKLYLGKSQVNILNDDAIQLYETPSVCVFYSF